MNLNMMRQRLLKLYRKEVCMKKVLMSLLLVLALIFPSGNLMAASIGDFGADSENYEQLQDIIIELKALYRNDEMFLMDARENGYTFDEYIIVKAEKIWLGRENAKLLFGDDLDGYGNNGQNYWANVKLIQQPDYYSCGATSALQVLYGMSRQGYVLGTTDLDKINTLKANTSTTTDGTMVYQVVNALNLYTPSYGNYGYYQISSSVTQAQFQALVQQSLYYDFGPILHADTSYLSYYGGYSTGHYIAVYALDLSTNQIGVKDCNYNNAYYGSHYDSIYNVYNCLHAQGRYLICYQ